MSIKKFRSNPNWPLCIFLLALLTRIGYLWLAPPRSMELDDSFRWNETALHFLRGEGFFTRTEKMDPKRPPTYPLFIAFIYSIFGVNNFVAVKIAQSILSALIAILIYLIGVSLFSKPVALWAGLLCAIYPPSIIYSGILQSETVFSFLSALFILFWVLSSHSKLWVYTVMAGIILGLATLCRGTLLFFSVFILGISFFQLGVERKNFVRNLVMVGVSLFVVLPWSVRNYIVYDKFIPVVSGGPEIFWFGTLPIESQKMYGDSQEFKSLTPILGQMSVAQSEEFFMDQALSNIKQSPGAYFILTIKKFFYFWFKPIGHELISKKSSFMGAFLFAGHFMLILFFAFGVLKTISNKALLMPLYSVIAYFALFHTALMPMTRFRLPIEPLMILFAVAGTLRSWRDDPSENL